MQGLISVAMKAKELLRGNCNSEEIPARIECGWVNITKEQCLARDCCFHNRVDAPVNCFVKRHLGELTDNM